jgi:hypothetical protein
MGLFCYYMVGTITYIIHYYYELKYLIDCGFFATNNTTGGVIVEVFCGG